MMQGATIAETLEWLSTHDRKYNPQPNKDVPSLTDLGITGDGKAVSYEWKSPSLSLPNLINGMNLDLKGETP